MANVSRLDTLLNALQKFYGALPAPPRDPFTLFVWEVLSVHSTPRKRDAALAALKRNVELNGGTIRVQSERGVGTTVTIALPV